MMSPAFTPRATASCRRPPGRCLLPHQGQHCHHSGVLIPEHIPQLPQGVASPWVSFCTVTWSPPRLRPFFRGSSAPPADSLALYCSMTRRASFNSATVCSAFRTSSAGFGLHRLGSFHNGLVVLCQQRQHPRAGDSLNPPHAGGVEDSETMMEQARFGRVIQMGAPAELQDRSPICHHRTVSPYFSPKRAVAPSFFASSKAAPAFPPPCRKGWPGWSHPQFFFKSSREMAS